MANTRQGAYKGGEDDNTDNPQDIPSDNPAGGASTSGTTMDVHKPLPFPLPKVVLNPSMPYKGGFLHQKVFTDFLGQDNPLTKGIVSHLVLDRKLRIINSSGVEVEIDLRLQAKMSMVLSLGRSLLLNKRAENDVKLIAVGELLAVSLPPEIRDPKAEDTIKKIMVALLTEKNSYFVDDTIEVQNVKCKLPLDVFDIPNISVCIGIIGAMAQCLKPTYGKWMIDMHVEYYFAMANRGLATDNKITKLVDALQTQTGLSHALSKVRIAAYYARYGSYLNPDNAAEHFAAWIKLIPENAIQLRLILEQSAFSGLTQLMVVGRALIEYPDFPWATVASYFSNEFENYVTAMNLVKDNPYFGFRKSLGEAAAANYKSLAFTAKELLIAMGGNNSLKGYKGFVTSCPSKDKIKSLIRIYKYGKEVESEDELPDATKDLATKDLATRVKDIAKMNSSMIRGETNLSSRKRTASAFEAGGVGDEDEPAAKRT